MPFIQASSPGSDTALGCEIISLVCPFSAFQAKGSLRVYAVSDDVTLELFEKGIPFNVIPSSELGSLLTPEGLEAYRVQESIVESTVLNPELPPLNCIKAHIICDYSNVDKIRDILATKNATILSEETLSLNIIGSEGTEQKPAIKISFIVGREWKNIMYARLQTEWAGTKSLIRFVIEQDPDGPPRT